MPDVHALLSASSSHRWLNCPPSVRLEQNFPDTTSVFAEEGTFCHSLGEMKIRHYLHEPCKRPQSEEFDTEEIEQISDTYAQFVIEKTEEFRKNSAPLLMVEERVDYSFVAPGGFGTSDAVIIGKDPDGSGVLHICDLKTGKGVFVEVHDNSQLKLYALGALHAYEDLFDIDKVRMSIVQPRLDNIATDEMTAEDLKAWGESIKPIAKLAYEGKGKQKPGDWCRFCRAKASCKACADEAMGLVRDEFLDLDAKDPAVETGGEEGKSATILKSVPTMNSAPVLKSAPVFKEPALLSKSQIESLLPSLNRISNWIESVFAYVSSEAINHNEHWEGYKVVEGRSRRQFTNEKDVVDAAAKAGYTDLYKKQLMTLTEIEKLMGKKKFADILGDFVVKPPGKLSLVEDSDPRPAVDPSAAEDDFIPFC
ncbi:DUF2800 domain-containing protein [Bilifractor sp. LCP19S3_H10]|uniref:DUF2800 domain-containing protein n=1 Tax=Lachnospiraceae TaxID=186803 RepID=UPI003F9139D7